MNWIPGWETVASASWWATFWFWASIVSLLMLGVSEVVSHRYTERKDVLVADEQDATQRRHDEEMARVHLETAQAIEGAAQANAKAAGLQLQLDQERQRHAIRTLTDDQKATFVTELKGKIPSVNLVIQRDWETRIFALQLAGIFGQAGSMVHPYDMPAGDILVVPAGLMMYAPGGAANEADMASDPLYLALKKAGLFGGFTGLPLLSPGFSVSSGVPLEALPKLPADQWILYVGQKHPG